MRSVAVVTVYEINNFMKTRGVTQNQSVPAQASESGLVGSCGQCHHGTGRSCSVVCLSSLSYLLLYYKRVWSLERIPDTPPGANIPVWDVWGMVSAEEESVGST